jgi:tetratricopeptide (TPR) repeat protein
MAKASFQDSCRAVTIGDQLKNIAGERVDLERFKENIASSSRQEIHFSSEGENYAGEYFELEKEEDNEWSKELKESIDEIYPQSWTEQYQGCPLQIHEGEWAREFSWNYEYDQPGEEAAEDWIKEYLGAEGTEEDSEKLAESATQLLASMDMSNEKLRNSQFVKYLRRLADHQAPDSVSPETLIRAQESFEGWREQYRNAIDPLVNDEDRSWESWEKDWQRYGSNGIGYEGFAQREFQRYQFSSENPFTEYSEAELKRLAENSKSLRERIMAHEALLQKHSYSHLWSSLGFLQSDNEMDIQAIAAHQEALSQNQNLNDSWLGLALACINERCIPDAYNALENWLRGRFSVNGLSVSAPNRNNELLRQMTSLQIQKPNDPDILMVVSILQSLSDQNDLALQHMQQALAYSQHQTLLLNRIGAMLANQSRYKEALSFYYRALDQGLETPRIHYNIGISLMCLNRLQEAKRAFIHALKLQTSVSQTPSIRPDLRGNYRTIWETLRLLCELEGDARLVIEAELGNIDSFTLEK